MRIAHRVRYSILQYEVLLIQPYKDINPQNIMHRWFDPYNPVAYLPSSERRLGGTWYCVMDYDLSLLHDQALDVTSYFRPAEEAWIGSPRHHPDDYSQGEWQYNPFAFDVGCLGQMIMSKYAVRVPSRLTHSRLTLLGCHSCRPVTGASTRQDDNARHL